MEGSELLPCPLCRWMIGDVRVQDPAGADLHRDEHIEDLGRRRHRSKEIAGDNGVGVVLNKCTPPLPNWRPAERPASSDHHNRNREPELG
jgi:hypothetical protein